MNRFFLVSLITAVSSLFVISCSGSPSNINDQNTKFPEGRELYFSKCTSCHKAYDREMLSADKWKIVLDKMTIKAKLNTEEKILLLNYLSERYLNTK